MNWSIHKLQQGERPVSEFFTELKTMWDELENLNPLPTCECAPPCACGAMMKVRAYRDKDHVIRFLKGLNDQYASLRSQIMILDPLPNINKAFSMIVQQERQLGSDSGNIVTNNVQSFAMFNNNAANNSNRRSFTPNGGRYNRGRGFAGRNGPGRGFGGRVCTHCGRSNHTVETCYQLHGYPPGYRSRVPDTRNANHVSTEVDSSSMLNNNHISQDQYQHILSILHSNKSDSTVTSTSHHANVVQISNAETNASGISDTVPGDDWYC